MKCNFASYPFIVALLTLAAYAAFSHAEAPLDESSTQISTDRIGDGVELIGCLGKPLGTTVQISGRWHYPTSDGKDYSIRFTVKSLDGVALTAPVEFNVAQMQIFDESGVNKIPEFKQHSELDGKHWTFMAYETGRISVSPKWYDKSHVRGSIAAPYYIKPFTPIVVGRLENTKGSSK